MLWLETSEHFHAWYEIAIKVPVHPGHWLKWGKNCKTSLLESTWASAQMICKYAHKLKYNPKKSWLSLF